LESFRYLELGDKNFTDLIKDELTGGFGFAGEIIICIAKIKLSLSDIPSNPIYYYLPTEANAGPADCY
jgi:hypothetical protein